MKKIALTLLAALCLTSANAQKTTEAGDIYMQVKNGAELALQDPQADDNTILLSQYKLAALGYMVRKGVETTNGKGLSVNVMDRQAYALNSFLTKYLTEIITLSSKGNTDGMKACIKKYWQFSHKHPMFGDKDTETTNAFYGTLMSFSLDTNWEDAMKEVED